MTELAGAVFALLVVGLSLSTEPVIAQQQGILRTLANLVPGGGREQQAGGRQGLLGLGIGQGLVRSLGRTLGLGGQAPGGPGVADQGLGQNMLTQVLGAEPQSPAGGGSVLGLGRGLGQSLRSLLLPAGLADSMEGDRGDRSADGITFYFFSREHAGPTAVAVGDSNALDSSGFNHGKPTKVLIHGFGGSLNNSMIQTMKDAYISAKDVNVIAVDWSPLSSLPRYDVARGNVDVVGPQLATLLDWLSERGADMSSFHLLGHSLGAHVAGIASDRIRRGQIARISGLDPARPGFRNTPLDRRLDSGDARLVDVIHTTAGWYGMEDPIGHLDFYPNGGIYRQPGCSIDAYGRCSHAKAYTLFRDSIGKYDINAVGCDSVREAYRGSCHGKPGRMGEPADQAGFPVPIHHVSGRAGIVRILSVPTRSTAGLLCGAQLVSTVLETGREDSSSFIVHPWK